MIAFHKLFVPGLFVPGLLVVAELCSSAQENKTQLKKEPAKVTSAASGKEMFTSYCAACHGTDGKGNGPAAKALTAAPADLTVLAKRNGGKYPSDKVAAILRGQTNLMPHGDQEMPVWGPVFRQMSGGDEGQVTMRIANLNRYLESVQTK
jgi:mono/diheme cytochrome c family protein